MQKAVKTASLFSLFVIVLSCQTYNNFSAYYNTYYNAKQSFKKGLEKVERHAIVINPDRVISLYPKFPVDGESNFEQAIENAAQVIRRFPNSKWLDDALLLIGKSHYYLHDYYNALQKFETIIELKRQGGLNRQAVIWKSKTLYELGFHEEGIQFLKGQLALHGAGWNPRQAAQIKTSLASHLSAMKNYSAAIKALQPAISFIDENQLKARAYFLLGQLFMRQARFNKAYQAFSFVENYLPEPELAFYAKIKAAQAAVKSRRFALANSIYAKMLSDDKFYKRRFHVLYYLGHTAEQSGNYSRAISIYKQILKSTARQTLDGLPATIYFRLSQIYSRQFNNFQRAAAYLDSSKAGKNQTEEDATIKAYGDYVTLKSQINRIDSLLWLANLPPDVLDSVLSKIKKGREASRPLISEGNIVRNQFIDKPASVPTTGASSFWFLNYKNPGLVEQGMQSFKEVWGNRALADNWRRIESSPGSGNTTAINQPAIGAKSNNTMRLEETANLMAEIPITSNQKAQKREQKTELQYRLANLFFLTMNKPDSAVVYYKNVIDDGSRPELIAKALYSLYKLYSLSGNIERAQFYKTQILQKYNQTIYADRLIEGVKADSTEQLRYSFQSIANDTLNPNAKAQMLEKLALNHVDSPLAPRIYVRSIKEHIKAAKAADDSAGSLSMYSGDRWDKIRAMIDGFGELFPAAGANNQLSAWENWLSKKQSVATCSELSLKPKVKGGMTAFIKKVVLPPKAKAMNLSGSLTYQIVISEIGEVKSFRLISPPTGLGIEEAYNNAIAAFLYFEPVMYKNNPVEITCAVVFPIKK